MTDRGHKRREEEEEEEIKSADFIQFHHRAFSWNARRILCYFTQFYITKKTDLLFTLFMNRKQSLHEFYDNVVPIKLTEARRIKLFTKGWGILTEYYLDSVKVNHRKGILSSAATLRIVDKSGQTTCIVKGSLVGLLFGLPAEEWKDLENLCYPEQQLFYRNFKDGISKTFNYEQKIFYTFCSTNQRNEPLAATFLRCKNTRSNFRDDACIEIVDLKKCDDHVMNLYKSHLRQEQNKVM